MILVVLGAVAQLCGVGIVVWSVREDRRQAKNVLAQDEVPVTLSEIFKGPDGLDRVKINQASVDLDRLRRWLSEGLTQGMRYKLVGAAVTLIGTAIGLVGGIEAAPH